MSKKPRKLPQWMYDLDSSTKKTTPTKNSKTNSPVKTSPVAKNLLKSPVKNPITKYFSPVKTGADTINKSEVPKQSQAVKESEPLKERKAVKRIVHMNNQRTDKPIPGLAFQQFY